MPGTSTVNRRVVFALVLPMLMLAGSCSAPHDDVGPSAEAPISTEPAAPPVRLREGLVAHFAFEGAATDGSVFAHKAQVAGNLQYVPGIVGLAARFGGADDPATIRVKNTPALQFKTETTLSCWIRLESTAGIDGWGRRSKRGHHAIVGKGTDQTGRVLMLLARKQQYYALVVTRGGPRVKGDSSVRLPEPPTGPWMHVVEVVRPDGAELYLDGELVNRVEGRRDFAAANKSNLLIGGHPMATFPYPFHGDLDELRIYNRALNEAEVKALYAEGDHWA